jgi:hypothetical protein
MLYKRAASKEFQVIFKFTAEARKGIVKVVKPL